MRGLFSPYFCFCNNICVNDQRRPPEAVAVNTSIAPLKTKAVSVATIITTPLAIITIINANDHLGFSNLKMNANINTHINDEDLHIAIITIIRYTHQRVKSTYCRMLTLLFLRIGCLIQYPKLLQ